MKVFLRANKWLLSRKAVFLKENNFFSSWIKLHAKHGNHNFRFVAVVLFSRANCLIGLIACMSSQEEKRK
jgi:hypothetical protein